MIFRKQKSDNSVIFIDASHEFATGKNQNSLRQSDIKKLLRVYRDRQDSDKYAHLALPEEIAENDFNLNIPRYVDTFEEEEEIDLKAVHEERMRARAELASIEAEIDIRLKELGFAQ